MAQAGGGGGGGGVVADVLHGVRFGVVNGTGKEMTTFGETLTMGGLGLCLFSKSENLNA